MSSEATKKAEGGEEGQKRWPGMSDEAHPEVFNTIPPQAAAKKPGQLSNEQITQFFDKGFVLVEDFFSREELDPCKDAINVLVDELAQKLYDGGKITNLHKDCGFYKRLIMLEKDFPGANVILHKLGRLPQEFRNVWSNERLLNVAEQILGTSDIIGNPVWNLRTKTPKNEQTTVPWHQDSGYLDNESYNVLQLTAWIPLIDANENNGCMQMVQNGHKTGRIATHTCCWGNTWYIMLDEKEMVKTLEVNLDKDVVTCPVPYGGALFFSNAIPHRSLNNMSSDIRWSLDLRWQAADKPAGFYGLKDGVRLRSSDPDWKGVDWESFDSVNRHQKVLSDSEKQVADFDTTIFGPWMKKWELVHSNVHVEAMLRDEQEGDKDTKIPVMIGVDPNKDVVTCPVPYGGVLFFSNAIPHRSLNNVSSDIRWSLDLRWQSADKPVGFYGLKDGVRLRSSDPDWKGIEWEPFDSVDRSRKVLSDENKEGTEFDTTIFGPWMKKWELVHSNVHVEAMLRDEQEGGENKIPVVTG